MSVFECSNCGETLDPFVPLERYAWCGKCTIRAGQISESARKEFKLFGELMRKIREEKETPGGKGYLL